MHIIRGTSTTLLAIWLGVGIGAADASWDVTARPASADVSPAAARDQSGGADIEDKWSRQFYGGSAGFSTAGGYFFRISISTTARAAPPTRGMIAASARGQGFRVTRVGRVRGYTRKYVAFNARNARRNLSMRTGYTRVQSDAHHVMPRKFEKRFFRSKGINIHDPKNMTWWYRPSHQRYAGRYNRQWEKWIDAHPNATRAQVLRKANAMRAQYAHLYGKPGPAGCKPGRCRVPGRW